MELGLHEDSIHLNGIGGEGATGRCNLLGGIVLV